MREGIADKCQEAQDGQGQQNIKDGFSQSQPHYKCPEFTAMIGGIILNIKHDAKHGNKHEIFDKKQGAEKRKGVFLPTGNRMPQHRVYGNQACPGEPDDKWFKPAYTPEIIFHR